MLLSNPNIKHPHCQSWSKGCENKIRTASFFLPLPLIKNAAFIHTQDTLFSVRNNDTFFVSGLQSHVVDIFLRLGMLSQNRAGGEDQ